MPLKTRIALLSLALASCQTACGQHSAALGPPPASSARVERDRAETEVRSPLRVSLDGPAQVGPHDVVMVRLRIERDVPIGADVHIRATIPPGVRMNSGSSSETLAANVQPDRVERRWELSFEAIPPGDFVVEIDARGDGFGQHTVGTYRFGRPEPLAAVLRREPVPLLINGRGLVRPVLVDDGRSRSGGEAVQR